MVQAGLAIVPHSQAIVLGPRDGHKIQTMFRIFIYFLFFQISIERRGPSFSSMVLEHLGYKSGVTGSHVPHSVRQASLGEYM